MKKVIFFLIAAVALTACNRVSPNYEGVLMQNYGQNGRVDYSSVTGNQGILGPGSDLFQVPMYEQSADVDPVQVLSKDAGVFTVDPKYTYQAVRGSGVDIIFNYKHVGATGDEAMMDNIEVKVLSPLALGVYRDIARLYTTDSLMFNMGKYEQQVQDSLATIFLKKFFTLNQLTSGLQPPKSTASAIEARNNAKIKAEQVENELQIARMEQDKARIEQETNKIKSQGLTKEILTERYIEALRWSNNRIIITDGKTPVILNN